MNADYIVNWLALGACIYSRKTADAALAALGLRKAIKRKPMRPDRVSDSGNRGSVRRIIYAC